MRAEGWACAPITRRNDETAHSKRKRTTTINK
jgi:hypothetical protein